MLGLFRDKSLASAFNLLLTCRPWWEPLEGYPERHRFPRQFLKWWQRPWIASAFTHFCERHYWGNKTNCLELCFKISLNNQEDSWKVEIRDEGSWCRFSWSLPSPYVWSSVDHGNKESEPRQLLEPMILKNRRIAPKSGWTKIYIIGNKLRNVLEDSCGKNGAKIWQLNVLQATRCKTSVEATFFF